MPADIRHLKREHIEAWLIELLGRWKPATVNNRYRGLQAFFRWCLDEDIISVSPMAKMKPPKVPEQLVPVLRLDAVAQLIATAEKTKTFADVRDAAILRIFYSTGVRLAELANLRYLPDDPESNDVDLDQQVLRVLGKGGRQRLVNMGARSTKALDRYLPSAAGPPCHPRGLVVAEPGHSPVDDPISRSLASSSNSDRTRGAV